MKEIAIFQRDLGVGGIQKSLLNLLNNIDLEKFHIDLYLFSEQNFFENQIPKKVKIIYCKSQFYGNRFIYFSLLKKFKRKKITEKQYDVAIDFDSYQNDTALGAINVNANKKVMWIHNDVEKKLEGEPKYRILHHFFKGKYKYFDTFVGVSKGVIEPFQRKNKMENKEFLVIPNYVDANEILEKSKQKIDFSVDENKYNFCSVGRLCHQKGYDLTLNYLKELKQYRNDFHFYLIGDGPDRQKIEAQIVENGLENEVTLLGNQKNPFPYVNQMDGFLLTSRYEGQGIVILEAQALGLAIFITKNLEIYNEGITGYTDIVEALKTAKKSKKTIDLLEEYRNNITKRITDLLNNEKK